jgi:hypothetical protein
MCGYSISWIDSISSCYTLPSIFSVDGLIPLLLAVDPSPIYLMSCCMSTNSSCILSLWRVAWSKSLDRQSCIILEVISPSSFVIVSSGSVHCAFDFLRVPPVCVASILFPLGSCVLVFVSISCMGLACCYCSLARCVLSFFPF